MQIIKHFKTYAIAGFIGLTATLATPTAASADSLRATIIEAIQDSSDAPYYALLEKHFPKDYASLVRQLERGAKSNRDDGITRAVGRHGTAFYRKNARYLKRAPDQFLVKLFDFQYKNYHLFRNDQESCNILINQGYGELSDAKFKKLEKSKFYRDKNIIIPAMAAGRDTPVKRGRNKDEYYVELFELMYKSGLTPEDIDLLSEPDSSNPKTCKVYVEFFKALRDARFPGAPSLRAQSAFNLYK